jgi:hypothetical protein
MLERLFQPFPAQDLGHGDRAAVLVGNLSEHRIALLNEQLVFLLGGRDINPNAAPTHRVHQRHQVDFQAVGKARVLFIKHRIEALEQRQRGDRILHCVGSDIACGQLPQMRLRDELLAALLRNEIERCATFIQQGIILADKTAPLTQTGEAVFEAVLVDQGRKRSGLFEALRRRHCQAELGVQPAEVIDAVVRDEAQIGLV